MLLLSVGAPPETLTRRLWQAWLWGFCALGGEPTAVGSFYQKAEGTEENVTCPKCHSVQVRQQEKSWFVHSPTHSPPTWGALLSARLWEHKGDAACEDVEPEPCFPSQAQMAGHAPREGQSGQAQMPALAWPPQPLAGHCRR